MKKKHKQIKQHEDKRMNHLFADSISYSNNVDVVRQLRTNMLTVWNRFVNKPQIERVISRIQSHEYSTNANKSERKHKKIDYSDMRDLMPSMDIGVINTSCIEYPVELTCVSMMAPYTSLVFPSSSFEKFISITIPYIVGL